MSLQALKNSISTVLTNTAPANSITPESVRSLLLDIVTELQRVSTFQMSHNVPYSGVGQFYFDQSYPVKLDEVTHIGMKSTDLSGANFESMLKLAANYGILNYRDELGNAATYVIKSIDEGAGNGDWIIEVKALNGSSDYEYSNADVVSASFQLQSGQGYQNYNLIGQFEARMTLTSSEISYETYVDTLGLIDVVQDAINVNRFVLSFDLDISDYKVIIQVQNGDLSKPGFINAGNVIDDTSQIRISSFGIDGNPSSNIIFRAYVSIRVYEEEIPVS